MWIQHLAIVTAKRFWASRLKGVPQPYFLATKLGGRPQPFNPQDKDLLRRSVDESLRLLKRDHIDVLLVHEPDRPGQYDWWTDYDNFHGPVCDLLEELKAEKIIRFTGLGGTTAYQLPLIMATGNFDVVLTAFNYSLLWREATISIFPEAKRRDMGLSSVRRFNRVLSRNATPK